MLTSAAAAGQSSDRRFLAGLRERGLFQLAETYCLDRLGRPELPESRRADLVIELSRCLAERAVSSPREAREPLWQRALQVTEEFGQESAGNPRVLLVRLQGALGLLSRGELARQEAQLVADRGTLVEEARTYLRAAVGRLQELAEEVERRLRQQNLADQREPAGLTAHQLASLQKNIQYELARALRNQAQCYASDSPDRANSLIQAVKLLEPLAKLDPFFATYRADPLAWKSRIALIVSHRLLADYDAARRQLDALLRLEPPPPVELRARAEQIRLALATDRLAEAISLLSQGRQIDGATSAELDYAWLETHLDAGRAAGDANDSTKAAGWQAKATEMAERIEQLHGPYWARRAGMLLSRYVQASPESSDLEMLVRAAESSFRSDQFDDALAAYDRARTLAAAQGNAAGAFKWGYVAATIEHQRNRHDEALARYHQISTASPDHAKAPEAHLLAIYHASQLAKGQPEGYLDQYVALLQEHLRIWPNGPSADKVWRQLGQLREHQRHWESAIDAFRQISPGHTAADDKAEYLQSVEAAGRCYQAWLGERKAAGKPTEQSADQAADWFESVVVGPEERLPERWSPLERRAALAAARLRLDYTAAGYARAHNVLSAALQGATDAPPEWKSAARGLLVLSLAGQGRTREASELLWQISAGPPGELLTVLEGLGRVGATARLEVRTELAELQLRAIELLLTGRTQLSQAQQQSLERIHAQALADAGRTKEALQAYGLLAEKYPRDGAIQEAYAQLLLTREDRASLATALAKWRELEKKSRPGSPRWFRAKYSVAWLHCQLGNKQQAAKMIRLLQLLHPESGGPEMKPRFDELLKRCRE